MLSSVCQDLFTDHISHPFPQELLWLTNVQILSLFNHFLLHLLLVPHVKVKK